MIRILLTLFPMFLCSRLGSAEPVQGFEVFGGYSHLFQNGVDVPGWIASGSINTNRWFGAVADVSNHYYPEASFASVLRSELSQSNSYRFLFGPEFSFRRMRTLTPRFHLLLGIVHTRTHASGIIVTGFPDSPERTTFSATTSENAFSGGAGVSLDMQASRRFGFRLIQADYLRAGKTTLSPDSVRLSAGIVVQLGGRP